MSGKDLVQRNLARGQNQIDCRVLARQVDDLLAARQHDVVGEGIGVGQLSPPVASRNESHAAVVRTDVAQREPGGQTDGGLQSRK